MQLRAAQVRGNHVHAASQSPYGAKWFATRGGGLDGPGGLPGVAIPLRGYVVCNEDLAAILDAAKVALSQSPHGAKWVATSLRDDDRNPARNPVSKSPYGAKWFATRGHACPRCFLAKRALSQSPYGAKWFATSLHGVGGPRRGQVGVAIPLRGYVVCNEKDFQLLMELLRVAIPLRG